MAFAEVLMHTHGDDDDRTIYKPGDVMEASAATVRRLADAGAVREVAKSKRGDARERARRDEPPTGPSGDGGALAAAATTGATTAAMTATTTAP